MNDPCHNGSNTPCKRHNCDGKLHVVNRHKEWEGDERMYRWNVNEIACKCQTTWCSDEFLKNYVL